MNTYLVRCKMKICGNIFNATPRECIAKSAQDAVNEVSARILYFYCVSSVERLNRSYSRNFNPLDYGSEVVTNWKQPTGETLSMYAIEEIR